LAVFKVDHQLELGWLQDRQVGGLGALENPPDVYARLAIVVAAAASKRKPRGEAGLRFFHRPQISDEGSEAGAPE